MLFIIVQKKIKVYTFVHKGIILLPNNDIRLEFQDNETKNIIDVSEMFHDNKLLVIGQIDTIEESTNISELPKIGVISKINHKVKLPNGNIRVTISGISRAYVHEYMNLNNKLDSLECITSEILENKPDVATEPIILKKLYNEFEKHIRIVPYITNSILSTLVTVKTLSQMTDIIANQISSTNERLNEYLLTFDINTRVEMVLKDIYQEQEMYKIEKELEQKVKKSIDNSQKEYFLREKIKVIREELGDVSSKDEEIDSLREKLNVLDAPKHIKDRLNNEIRKLDSLTNLSPEINVVRTYIDWLFDLPWNSVTTDNDDLRDVKKKFDESHYGLEKVKERIIEYLAVKKVKGNMNGPIICLVGPPGVGKTSLAFSVAHAMNRKFTKISVGGLHDECEIIGHRRSYLGAEPGRIIQGLKKAGSSNPVFLIDEIDKMTKDIKGDPASALLDVLDPEQNKCFRDNYIEEEIDLSNVMFLATANYIEDIPEALRDRLEIIRLSGYTEFEKLDIVKTHLLKKICDEHGLNYEKINISDNVILKIIRNYTKEAGVRELERQLATIVRKIITKLVMNNIKIDRINILEKDLEKYLGKIKFLDSEAMDVSQIGVVNGLAYTQFGGDTLPIEVNYFKGNGNLVLTGSLGDVMKESAQIALSYIKANYKKFKIDYEKLTSNDIHIHVPEGATPKDGPSAGVTLTTALISAFSNLKIDKTLAMTGEITLRGKVLPIGGLKEKSMGAYRNGIKRIIIPKENIRDLDDVPTEVKRCMEYIPVSTYDDIYKVIKESEREIVHV